MNDENPPSWLGPDGELLVADSSLPKQHRPFPGAVVFIVLVLVGMFILVGTAFYFQQGVRSPIATRIPVTPGAEIPMEFFDARYGVQIRYDYSQIADEVCSEQRVYGTVEGAETFSVRAESGGTILKDDPIQAERQFNLIIPIEDAPRFDVWLIDGSGEQVTGVRNVNLGQLSGIQTCTIEVTFYPSNQSG